nr:MAG TPA: hypothetical protein [Caudoviricetes sp.]
MPRLPLRHNTGQTKEWRHFLHSRYDGLRERAGATPATVNLYKRC